jgi:hypothetical protein
MIVKGRARSGPEQLAAYLLRVGDGEHATILDRGLHGEDLRTEFLLWHTIGDAGKTDKTLYHAQICPEAKYGREMTPAEWLRSAEMLAEDMGMADHPRRVVLHDGGDKPHLHVVFQRADPETLKMWEVWQNFKKHEQASLRMSKEFDMEIIPGKHAKRDREKQPEFPRAESTQADHQQAARTNMSFEDRKAHFAGIRKPCDDAHAFKNALEEAGYILAKGDTRGFVAVDGDGEVYSLSKHLADDIKGKAYKAFMAPIDPATLPSVDEAKAQQSAREQAREERSRTEAPAQVDKRAPQASKFLTPETTLPVVQPPAAPEKQPAPIDLTATARQEQVSKFLPPEMAAKVEDPTPAEPVAPAADQKPYDPAYAPTEPPTASPIEKRRAPLPSDPWMAQTGGADKLSPAHLESAQNSYEKWAHKDRYDFANYVAYVQRQWEDKALPPPPGLVETPAPVPSPAAEPTPTETKKEPPKKKGYDYGAYSPAGPVMVPAPPPPPAPPQPKAPDLAEGPKPTWIKERVPLVPAAPKQPGYNFDTYAPKAPEPAAPPAPDVRDQKLKEEFQQPAASPAPPPPKPEPTIDPEVEVIRKRIFARQQAENRKFLQLYAAEERDKAQAIERMGKDIAAANVDKMEAFDFQQRAALQAEVERHAPRKGVKEALRKFFKPEDEEAKAAERQEEMDLFRSQQAHDRRAYIKSLEESRDDTLNHMRDQLKALREEHQAEQRERNKGYDEELARRLRERQKAIDIAREQSKWDKDFEKEQEQRWDDPDVPRRGK